MSSCKTVYDYTKLNRRIKTMGFSQETLAPKLSISRTSLNLKLNSKSDFTQKEMLGIAKALNIGADEFGDYFFNVFVQKTVLKEEVC